MSIAFSNTTNKNGLIQIIERNCGFNDGDISGNSTLLAQFTGEINLALDKMTEIAVRSSGKWDWDDSNQTDYPIITTNLVSGQRDYPFTTDGTSNIILEVKKVFAKISATGIYEEIYPVNEQEIEDFNDGNNSTGVPYRYGKLSNAIFLDPIPNYNSSAGLKMYISRESTYFQTSDTTKKAGFPGIFQEYLALKPSYNYARNHLLNTLSRLEKDVLLMERSIQDYFSFRSKDEHKILANKTFNYR